MPISQITKNSQSIVVYSTSKPQANTNPDANGTIWIDTQNKKFWICSDNTNNNNIWFDVENGLVLGQYKFDPDNPFDYGDGTDGATSSPSSTTTYLTSSVTAGQKIVSVASVSGFSVGDQVILWQVQNSSGLSPSFYEILQINGISGTSVSFTSSLVFSYTDGTNDGSSSQTALMVRVPQYTTVTISSDTAVSNWSGTGGGILAFKANTSVSITAHLNATGRGFRGFPSQDVSSGGSVPQGEGQLGKGSNSSSANGIGGGGGKENVPGTTSQLPGGGGGHATAGADSTSSPVGGLGGSTYGFIDLTTHLGFGGAGGAGGYDYSNVGGAGANGGGVIIIVTPSMTISGSGKISANGSVGGSGPIGAPGGSGAGGSIFIKTDGNLTTNNQIFALGGASNGNAGSGGNGRIHIVGSYTGSPVPTPFTS